MKIPPMLVTDIINDVTPLLFSHLHILRCLTLWVGYVKPNSKQAIFPVSAFILNYKPDKYLPVVSCINFKYKLDQCSPVDTSISSTNAYLGTQVQAIQMFTYSIKYKLDQCLPPDVSIT